MSLPRAIHGPVDAAELSRLVFGDFALDLATGTLRRRGEPVDLEPQPTKVLRFLALRSGEVVLREELHRHLWGEGAHVEADQGLNYCIKELRRALGDAARQPRYIETLPRRGYRFLPSVELAAPAADAPTAGTAGGEAAPPPDGAALPRGHRPLVHPPRRPLWWVLGVGALLAAAVLASGWLRSGPVAADPVTEPAAAPAVRATPRVAVLPFEAPDGAPEDEALARRLANELVSALARADGLPLEVVSATSSFAAQDGTRTAGEIGRDLRAAYVVEGAARASDPGGDGARLCVRLVDTADETVVWAESYRVGSAGARDRDGPEGVDGLAGAVVRDLATHLDPVPSPPSG